MRLPNLILNLLSFKLFQFFKPLNYFKPLLMKKSSWKLPIYLLFCHPVESCRM